MSSPADVIVQMLKADGIGVKPTSATRSQWPIYSGFLPDTPDMAFVVYDTTPVLDGRYMSTGKTVEHPGIQVLVRSPSNNYTIGWDKIRQVADAFDGVLRRAVAMPDADWLIHAITRTSGPASMGQEPEQRRFLFTLNATVTLSVVA